MLSFQANVENMKMFNNRAAAGGGLMLSNGAGISFIQGSRDTLNSVFENNTAYDGGAWFFLGAGNAVVCWLPSRPVFQNLAVSFLFLCIDQGR